MDIQKERKVKRLQFGICSDEKCDKKSHILEECYRCLKLFCPEHSWMTPRGNSCVDCYPALYPEVMFGETLNWLSKVH